MPKPFLINVLQMLLIGGVAEHYYTLSCQFIRNTHFTCTMSWQIVRNTHTLPVFFSSFIRHLCNGVELQKHTTGTITFFFVQTRSDI